MSGRLALGLVFLIAGIVVAVWGYNDMNSLGNEAADALNLEENNGQIVMFGGVAVALVGIVLAATRGRTA